MNPPSQPLALYLVLCSPSEPAQIKTLNQSPNLVQNHENKNPTRSYVVSMYYEVANKTCLVTKTLLLLRESLFGLVAQLLSQRPYRQFKFCIWKTLNSTKKTKGIYLVSFPFLELDEVILSSPINKTSLGLLEAQLAWDLCHSIW